MSESAIEREVVYAYTRAQAIEDGVLIEVSEMAKEVGIKYPVALTRTLWDAYIIPDKESESSGQSEQGRLWDTLFMFMLKARRTSGAYLLYDLMFLMKGAVLRKVKVKAVCGPGDNGEPVITIMMPNED